MQPTAQEYQKLLTEIIQKLIIVFGPAVVLSKARNIQGLSVSDSGEVTNISADPLLTTQKAIEDFKELASEAVQKIIDPLIVKHPGVKLGDDKPATPPEETQSTAQLAAPMPAPVSAVNSESAMPPLMPISAPMPAPVPVKTEENDVPTLNMQNTNISGQSKV